MNDIGLPHSEQIERSVIAAFIMEPCLIDKALSMGIREEMFFSQSLRLLWNAANALFSRTGSIDVILLAEELKSAESAFSGDIHCYLACVLNAIATTAGFRDW